ncbi:hypothetical protein, partial [Spiroplasma poulsonii]|uniref:hypothetical protein n=1 Tax=Spiroplasma poulsonii TaxID=2138 RepID=UPI001A7E0ACF
LKQLLLKELMLTEDNVNIFFMKSFSFLIIPFKNSGNKNPFLRKTLIYLWEANYYLMIINYLLTNITIPGIFFYQELTAGLLA